MSPRASELVTAFSLLSRLPLPRGVADPDLNAASVWAYGAVGLGLGLLASLAMLCATLIGLPAPLVALTGLGALIALSGAMHEDGLADVADGFWGGWTQEIRLEIMRDSRIGTYGVLALILSLGARWVTLWYLIEISTSFACAAVIASAALSRALMPFLMALLPHARKDGLSHGVGLVSLENAWLGLAIAFIPALIFAGFGVFPALFWAALLTWGMARLARAKIGGQSGDVLGATQQVAEIAILASLLI